MTKTQFHLARLRDEINAGQGSDEIFRDPIALEPGREPRTARAYDALCILCLRPSIEDKDGVLKAHQFLQTLSVSRPVSFEVIGVRSRIQLQIVSDQCDQASLMGLVSSLYPNAEAFPSDDALRFCRPTVRASVFRLDASHVFPLNTRFNVDPLCSLFGVLTVLSEPDFGGVQVVFEPVQGDWHSRILRCSRSPWDPARSLFIDLPDLPKVAQEKCSSRMFAVSLRLFASTERILASLEGFLNQFSGRNCFLRLPATYPGTSVLSRSIHSPGCILNAIELSGLVHLPGRDAFVPQLETARKTAPPPDLARNPGGILFGENIHRGRNTPVVVGVDHLTKHLVITGSTGSGKSVAQAHFFRQFIREGGAIYIDPSGDHARTFLKLIDPNRAADAIYLDPTDPEYAPAFNPLAYTNDLDLARDSLLVSFRRLFGQDGMGPRSVWLLSQGLATLLTSKREPKTLSDLPLLFTDSAFRSLCLESVNDAALQRFWRDDFARLPQSAVLPLLNKLHAFIGNQKISSILCQSGKIDLWEIIRNRQILVVNLSKGQLGESVAATLGFLFLSAFQQTVLSLSRVPQEERHPVALMVDEAHVFLGRENVDTMHSLLSESRKFRISVVLATQTMASVDPQIRASIMGNVGSILAFRVGVDTARLLEKELAPFAVEDLLNLSPGEAICRVGTAQGFNIKTPFIDLAALPSVTSEEIIQRSRQRYYTRRDHLRQPIPVSSKQQAREKPSRERIAPERPALTLEEQAFLRCVYDQPTLSVTQVYRVQNLSAYRGDRIKRTLVERRVLSEITTHLGKGSRIAKFLVLTPKAFQALGVDFNAGDGKGGMLHRYWQSVIRFHAEGKGYTATIEEPIPGSRESADIGLQREGERIAVEISVTTSVDQELANVTKCLRAGFGRIIVLMLDDAKVRELTARVQTAISDEDHSRVAIGLVHDFCRFL